MKWKPITKESPKPGRYLVTVDCGDEREVHTLERDKKGNFIHEGEPTFCHGYQFTPIAWAKIPKPYDGIMEDDE